MRPEKPLSGRGNDERRGASGVASASQMSGQTDQRIDKTGWLGRVARLQIVAAQRPHFAEHPPPDPAQMPDFR